MTSLRCYCTPHKKTGTSFAGLAYALSYSTEAPGRGPASRLDVSTRLGPPTLLDTSGGPMKSDNSLKFTGYVAEEVRPPPIDRPVLTFIYAR